MWRRVKVFVLSRVKKLTIASCAFIIQFNAKPAEKKLNILLKPEYCHFKAILLTKIRLTDSVNPTSDCTV